MCQKRVYIEAGILILCDTNAVGICKVTEDRRDREVQRIELYSD